MRDRLDTDDLDLKEATRKLQKAAGGVEECERVTETGKTQHGNYQSPNSFAFITIEKVRMLEARTVNYPGWPHVTRALCKQAGGVFVPIPRLDGGHEVLPGQVMVLAKELGEVSAKITEGLADDDELNVKEIDAILAEQDDLDRASHQLRHTLTALRAELVKDGG